MAIQFTKAVVNPEQPQGRVALRLRELVNNSRIRSSEELKQRTNYAGSTLSEAMSGRRRQTPAVITKIVQACVPVAEAEDEIERLVAVLDQNPETATPNTPPVVELRLDEETQPRRWPWWLRGRWLVVVVVLVLVLAGAGYGISTALQPTYISDGSANVPGDPAFAMVLGKIKAENDRVLGAPDHLPVVSVAYTAPFPANHTELSDRLLRELEGAYIMQLQRNEAGGSNPLGGPPRVQLLIANLGDQAAQETTVVSQLQDRTDPGGQAPLVAVVGLDQNLPGVADAINGLGRAGIPTVAGQLVADSFGVDAVDKGFFAAAPPVRDQVAAAALYLRGQARRPLLVQDTTTADLYGRDIADQFRAQFAAASPGRPLPAPVSFNSSLQGVQTAFANGLPAICQLQPDLVFYAGGGANLPDFIRALGTRSCQQVPVTVLTLSDGRELANAIRAENATGSEVEHQLNAAMLGGVKVILTAQAHPGVWADEQLEPPQSHAVLNGQFATAFPQQFPRQRVVDDGGDVIMGHDAMQVVVEAIARSRPAQSSDPVTTELVRQALSGITPYTPVYGASGPIAYNEAGFPVDKNIPITEINPYGQITVLSPTTPQ